MRSEYYDIYRDLLQSYRAGVPANWRGYPWELPMPLVFGRPLRWVSEAVDDAVAELRLARTLRPDARHFLEVNLHQMVVLPLLHPEAPGPRTSGEGIQSILREDVLTILRAARGEKNENEISAHAILSAISDLWRKLRASSLDIWG